MKTCLLCKSLDTEEIAKLDSKKIIKRYQKTFNYNISYLFSESEIKLIKCNACDLRFFFPLVSGDENFYSVLQKEEYYYREKKEEYDVAKKLISKGSYVLDVGCGKGEFKKFVPESYFTGLEFSLDAAKSGQENGCEILNESIEEHSKLNFGKYDFVTAFQVLEHVTNISTFINACAKCVKPGGKLIIAVPSEESYLQFIPNAILNMPPHHISRWTDKALINLGKIIDLNFLNIFHDELDHLHVNSFFAALIERSLPFQKNNSVKLINESIIFKVRMKLALLVANRISKSCSHSAWQGKGQNVTVVFQKPNI